MIVLSQEIKDFLNKNEIKQLIKDDNWEEFCIEFSDWSGSYNNERNLYQFFRENGIDILPYIDFVPEYYFYGDESEKIILPNNIKRLLDSCFDSSKAAYIRLPKTLEEINKGVFYKTENLKEITIPSSVQFIDVDAFVKSSIETIYYSGTEEQWKEIYNGNLENIELNFI